MEMIEPMQSDYFAEEDMFLQFPCASNSFVLLFFMKKQQSQDAFILGGLAREKAQTSISVPILSLTGGAWERYLTSLNLSF